MIVKYLKKHRFQNQKSVIDGIPINPILRDEFDMTDNEERPQDEISDWWDKPYIITEVLDEENTTYEEYLGRSKEYKFTPESREEWIERTNKQRESWFESFPDGTRYMVRCLDGGAWDRSSNLGSYPTLKEALKKAKGN